MQAFEMAVSSTVETWTCNQPGCGQEFAVLMVTRPNKEFLDEYPDIPEARWSEWSNKAAQAPYCPHCGTRLTPNYGPDNPPRLRKPGESVEEYREAMGWGNKTPNV